MKLKCLLCDKELHSMILGDDEGAYAELAKKLNRHLVIRHPNEIQELQAKTMLLSQKVLGFFTMNETIDLDSEFTSQYIIDEFEKLENGIAELLGFNEESDEGEDEEETEIHVPEYTTVTEGTKPLEKVTCTCGWTTDREIFEDVVVAFGKHFDSVKPELVAQTENE
jgi:hypothetical protein